MADKLHAVELNASFLERLASIEAFLKEAGAALVYNDLLAMLRSEIIPHLSRFPLIGRRYLDHRLCPPRLWLNSLRCRPARPTSCANTCPATTLVCIP